MVFTANFDERTFIFPLKFTAEEAASFRERKSLSTHAFISRSYLIPNFPFEDRAQFPFDFQLD